MQSASVLVELQKVKDIQVELKTKQNELQKVDKELGSLKNIAERYASFLAVLFIILSVVLICCHLSLPVT